nr:dna replication regulator sld2 [Quercus suber]
MEIPASSSLCTMVMSRGDDHEHAAALRLELKRWENEWAAANGGKKPDREVVKNNASIAAKYKEYNRLSQRHVQPVETPRKRKAVLDELSTNPTAHTPKRATKTTTLSAKHGKAAHDEVELEPEPTPAFIRCALGPTPQRDGQVLGIFDALPSTTTPSKRKSLLDPIAATPSKPSAPPSSDPALSRTPQSTGKRFYLDAFTGTPLKRKREPAEEPATPSSAQRALATPSFLRRSFPLAPITEEEDRAPSGGALSNPGFRRRGGFVRTLSSMIQNLRRNEEQRMDDEWAVLQQLEAEEADERGTHAEHDTTLPPAARPAADGRGAEGRGAGAAEGVEMPLGPDQAAQGDEVDDGARERGALDAHGNPRKVWKKKGLKRQTKRVLMRPVLHKAQKAVDVQSGDADEEEEVCTAGAETQPDGSGPRAAVPADGDDSASEHEEAEDGEGKDGTGETARTRKAKSQTKDAGSATGKKKKVNELAHANFRKLKIKNKNSKANGRAGGGGGRRFGGRR